METRTTLSNRTNSARAVADVDDGLILASVEVAAPPERVFLALTSAEILNWWVRPGVFDTREWRGDVRVGGRWRASGIGGGKPYVLEGEFVEIATPRKLVQTWRSDQDPAVTTFTYHLDAVADGTRITLRHSGFTVPQVCSATCVGWETSFEQLAEMLRL